MLSVSSSRVSNHSRRIRVPTANFRHRLSTSSNSPLGGNTDGSNSTRAANPSPGGSWKSAAVADREWNNQPWVSLRSGGRCPGRRSGCLQRRWRCYGCERRSEHSSRGCGNRTGRGRSARPAATRKGSTRLSRARCRGSRPIADHPDCRVVGVR